MSIVFYQGRPLFRNGQIAMDRACCCASCLFNFSCTGQCWFPVSQPRLLTVAEYESNPVNFQTGGATQIQNFYYEISTDAFGIAQIFSQNGTSVHGIKAERCITDINDKFSLGNEVILMSRYFWFVPCEIINGGDPYADPGQTDILVGYSQEYGWGFAVFGLGQFETPVVISINKCSGKIEYSWTLGSLKLYFSMDVVGGLPLPAGFNCVTETGGERRLYKNGRLFFGSKSSFPSGYFPVGAI